MDIENESEITTSQEKVIEKFNAITMSNSDTITTENQRASISTLVDDDNETHSSDQTVVNCFRIKLEGTPKYLQRPGWDKLNKCSFIVQLEILACVYLDLTCN